MALFADILQSRTAAGVELVADAGGIREIRLCLLKKEKQTLKTVLTRTVYTLQELAELTKGIPVILVLSGKQILHKKVPLSSLVSRGSLAQKVLPNASDADFVIQQYESVSHSAYLSLVRKSYFEELYSGFQKEGIVITACYLGPFICQSLERLLNAEELSMPGYRLRFEAGRIEELQAVDTPSAGISFLRVGDDNVEQSLLTAFAAAFSHFAGNGGGLQADIPAVKAGAEEFRQKSIFLLAGKSVLVFFLLALLINYFVFDSYWQRLTDLQARYSMNQGLIARYEQLSQELKEKEQFLEKSGLLVASRSSYYADRLAEDISTGIRLTRLEINPLIKKESTDSLLEFRSKHIRVNGKCVRSIDLNAWIKVLKSKEWVKEVSILAYKQEIGEREGNFMLSLDIK
jgi:Tfp pilus assembly protein PilN